MRMGLERRGNGVYFYRKERRGNKVVSIYGGSGMLANCMHVLDQEEREHARIKNDEQQRAWDAEKRSQAEIDQLIETFSRDARAYEDALFLTNGYHLHSRLWRKKRR